MPFVIQRLVLKGELPTSPANLDAAKLAIGAVKGDVNEEKYLEWSDPDRNGGRGAEGWTPKLSKAKKFASYEAAFECWRAQSSVVPFRPDGKPNRPLTAFSVRIKEIA